VAGEKGAKAQKSFDLKQARLDSLYNAAYLRETDNVYFDRSKNDLGADRALQAVRQGRALAEEGRGRLLPHRAHLQEARQADRDDPDLRRVKKLYAKDPTFSPTTGQNYVMTFYEMARIQKTPKLQKPVWEGTISAYDKVFNDAVAARWTTAEDKAAYDRALILAREWRARRSSASRPVLQGELSSR